MRLLLWTCLTLLLAGAAAALAGAIWYRSDRPAMLAALCAAGLPNYSRPPEISADALGCDILGPKRRVQGVLVAGFEEYSFHSPNLERAPERGGSGGVWYETSQAEKLNPALAHKLDGLEENMSGAVARVTVEGWATIKPGQYGHLGQYSRLFFAHRVIALDPPPADFLHHLMLEVSNACSRDCGGGR